MLLNMQVGFTSEKRS